MGIFLRAPVSVFVPVVFALAIVGCSGDHAPTNVPPEVVVDTIVLSPSPLVAHVSDYVFVTASVYDNHGNRIESTGLQWSIENASLAYISIALDTLADLWGRSVGTTSIVASFAGKTTRLSFDVKPMVLARMIVAPGVAAVENGSQRQLQLVQLNPHNMAAYSPQATWISSDSTIASVDQSGKVTAHKEGTAQIQASADTLTASATIYVPSPFAAVATGASHACGLKADGRIFCWGANSQGQLGDNSVVDRPAAVEAATSARFASIYALASATCGLTGGGALYCWGYNERGRLGIAGSTLVTTPAVVPAPEPFSQVAPGGSHVCALGVSGKAYCWGVGSATGSDQDPVTAPTEIQGPVSLTSIVAGDQYTCAIGTDQKAYCWGVDFMGQLGDSIPDHGFTRGRATMEPVAGGHAFTSLFAGPTADNTCALDLTGSAWCWGDYVESDAAPTTTNCLDGGSTGPNRCSPMPVLVSSPTTLRSITTGLSGGCGLDAAQQTFCWGLNSKVSRIPTKVATSLGFQSIRAGRGFQCALSPSGMIYCWGDNANGQTGDYSIVPIPPGLYGTSAVSGPSLVAAP